jgi:GT2 family glycosyltransferase
VHVPRILGTVTPGAPESVKRETARNARTVAAYEGNAVLHPTIPEAVRVMRKVTGPEPRVTIVIPTKGDGWVLQPCLLPLLRMTDYANYEVLVIHTGERVEPELGEAVDSPRVRWAALPGPFNWSKINNYAVVQSGGDYLLFLNDDTRVLVPDWLSAMVATAQQPDVGVVGARLLHQHGTVQHVGVAAHNGLIGHIHFNLPANSPGYLGTAMLTHEAQAVTGACMLVSRDTFAAIGGFREDLSHNYNDIAFCLEARRLGLRNIVECRAELIHLAGATRPAPSSPEGMQRLMVENAIMGADYTEPDPYWNPNFTLVPHGVGIQGLNYEMLTWPADVPFGRERVLVLNDDGTTDGEAARLTRSGAVVFMADIHDFTVQMVAPALALGTWDLRDTEGLRRALRTLEVGRIVLSSLAGRSGAAAGVEALRALHRIGVPVHYEPRTPEVACPRITMLQDGVSCNDGWRQGIEHCQACVDRFGSPFGYVDVTAWQTAWKEVLYPEEVRDAAD